MSQWRLALWIAGVVAYAVLSHWMMLYHPAAAWALAALFGPLWLAAFGLAASRFGMAGGAVVVVAGVAAIVLVSRGEAGDPNRLYVLQHVAINAVLCAWFAGTLRGDRLSLIGEFAQRIHPLSDDMRVYTGKVTRLWAVYFALTAAASALIYATLSFSVWSLFANVISPALIGSLFLGEHFARYKLHPEFERTPLVDVIRACAGMRPAGVVRR